MFRNGNPPISSPVCYSSCDGDPTNVPLLVGNPEKLRFLRMKRSRPGGREVFSFRVQVRGEFARLRV